MDEWQGACHVQHGNAFGNADNQADAGIGGFEDGGGGDRGRNVDDGRIGLRCEHGRGDRVEHGDRTLELLAAFPRRHAGDDLRAVLDHLPGMKRSVAARDSLHDEARVLVDKDAHAAFPFAFATACFTASSMSDSAENPARSRIAMPSRSFVPVSRITMGTLSGKSLVA